MTKTETRYMQALAYITGYGDCMYGLGSPKMPEIMGTAYAEYFVDLTKGIENDDSLPEHKLVLVDFLKTQINKALGELPE